MRITPDFQWFASYILNCVYAGDDDALEAAADQMARVCADRAEMLALARALGELGARIVERTNR